MKNDKIFLAPECLGDKIELVAVNPDMYVNGIRQSQPVGYAYDVILREHESDKLRVHIAGPQQLEAPLSGFGELVVFEGLRVRPYVNRSSGSLAFSASADSIKVAPKSTTAKT